MTIREWNVVGAASLLAFLGAGCAGMGQRSSSTNPTTQQVQSSQKESQAALDRANEAQKRASDATRRVADAQADVQKAQQQLSQAQRKLQDEQANAERLQREAVAANRQASQQAAEAQAQAIRGIEKQGKEISQGQQVIQGQITAASGGELSVRPEGGHSMTFQMNDRTRVTINGRAATVDEIQQGQDARVAYELSGTTPTAISVSVGRAKPGTSPSGATPESGSPTQGDSSQGTGSTVPQGDGSSSGSSQPQQPGGRY